MRGKYSLTDIWGGLETPIDTWRVRADTVATPNQYEIGSDMIIVSQISQADTRMNVMPLTRRQRVD